MSHKDRLHGNFITDQAAGPRSVLGSSTGGGNVPLSEFDQERQEHGPHLQREDKPEDREKGT